MTATVQDSYFFGEFRIDTSRRLLERDGAVVAISPKVFDTLLILIENVGRVVSRDELINELWPNTYVEEGNLTYNISILRKILGERPHEHRFVATVPGRGYVFVADLQERSGKNDRGAADSSIKTHTPSSLIEHLPSKFDRPNPRAYDLYLNGLYHWNRFLHEGTLKAVEYFHRVIDFADDYAPAHARLSDSYYRLSNIYLEPRVAMQNAKAFALKAVALDGGLAEGHTALAVVLDQYDWDWPAAEIEYQRAIDCDSKSVIALQRYGRFLTRMGRFDEALSSFEAALELDPFSLIVRVSKGSLFNIARRFDRCVEQFERTLEMNPDYYPARFGLAQAYQFKGKVAEALKEYQRAISIYDNPEILARYGQALAVAGRKAHAKRLVTELEERRKQKYVSPFYIGLVHAALGDLEEAFRWLEIAEGERNAMLTWLRVHPELDSLRDDRRFHELAERVWEKGAIKKTSFS